jgi:hypothetical protein
MAWDSRAWALPSLWNAVVVPLESLHQKTEQVEETQILQTMGHILLVDHGANMVDQDGVFKN